MANTIEYAVLFQDGLDKVLAQELTTGWMEANAQNIIYNGGNTIKIGKLGLSALADYDRATGYKEGDVDLTFQTHTFLYDRGRRFTIDAMDVDESNFLATASNVMGQFVRTKAVPEVDLVRIATVAGKAHADNVDVQAADESALAYFKRMAVKIRDAGYAGQLVAHVSYNFLTDLELEIAGNLSDVTFAVNGVDTTFPAIDGIAIIPTVSGAMHDAVTKDAETGVIAPAVLANALDFVIAGRDVPVAIAKHDKARTFTPEEYQAKDAYAVDYRLYHTVLVEDNQVKAVAVGKVGE